MLISNLIIIHLSVKVEMALIPTQNLLNLLLHHLLFPPFPLEGISNSVETYVFNELFNANDSINGTSTAW